MLARSLPAKHVSVAARAPEWLRGESGPARGPDTTGPPQRGDGGRRSATPRRAVDWTGQAARGVVSSGGVRVGDGVAGRRMKGRHAPRRRVAGAAGRGLDRLVGDSARWPAMCSTCGANRHPHARARRLLVHRPRQRPGTARHGAEFTGDVACGGRPACYPQAPGHRAQGPPRWRRPSHPIPPSRHPSVHPSPHSSMHPFRAHDASSSPPIHRRPPPSNLPAAPSPRRRAVAHGPWSRLAARHPACCPARPPPPPLLAQPQPADVAAVLFFRPPLRRPPSPPRHDTHDTTDAVALSPLPSWPRRCEGPGPSRTLVTDCLTDWLVP